MDRQLLERLIGAGVLVVALVIIVPAILDGGGDSEINADRDSAVTPKVSEPRRTHTIRLDREKESPPVAREVTQPPVTTAGQSESGNSPAPPRPVTSEQTKPVTRAAAKAPAPESPVPESPEPRPSPPPARAPDPEPAKPVTASQSGWAVQLGSFSNRLNAQKLADEVGGRGFPVFLMSIQSSGKTLYRVRVGPRESRAQANELAERLKKAGYSGRVTQ